MWHKDEWQCANLTYFNQKTSLDYYSYLKDFDHTLFILCDIYCLKYFAVLSTTKFPNRLVVVLLPAKWKKKLWSGNARSSFQPMDQFCQFCQANSFNPLEDSPPSHNMRLIVPVVPRSLGVYISVDSGPAVGWHVPQSLCTMKEGNWQLTDNVRI